MSRPGAGRPSPPRPRPPRSRLARLRNGHFRSVAYNIAMSSDTATDLLSRINERRILDHIRKHGPGSRAAMARRCGLSAPTVSKAVGSLIRTGFLEESGEAAEAFGRPGKLIRLSERGANVIGVVVDAAGAWVGWAGLDGRGLGEGSRSFPIPAGYGALLSRLTKAIEDCAGPSGGESRRGIRGVGLSVPGLLEDRHGVTMMSPNLHLLDGHALAHDLARRTGLPCVARQESHALCLGERLYGAARDLEDFAMLDVSTGLGLGIVSGGRLLTGSRGLAGELGHLTVDLEGPPCGCGNRGCLETLATDSAFLRGMSRLRRRPCGMEEALEALRRGRRGTGALLERTLDYLAVGIAAVVNLFNPSTLFLHGGLLASDPALLARAIEKARRRSLGPSFEACRILPSRGNKRLGAVAGIVHHLTESIAPELPPLQRPPKPLHDAETSGELVFFPAAS
jgi:predicted NBD/HSP70 family sugar kinase